MGHAKQTSFYKTDWRHKDRHGGELRRSRKGRGVRPLSTKDSLHVVFKINIEAHARGLRSPKSYTIVNRTIERYARRFFVKIASLSVQGDHIHLLIKTTKRSFFHHFFRVVAGQIAQQLLKGVTDTPAPAPGSAPAAGGKQSLWKFRPFSRVVRGRRAYETVRNYIQLNEKEALGVIAYRKDRLRGMSDEELRELWV